MDERELGLGLLDAQPAIKQLPLVRILALLCLSLLFFLLRCLSQFVELLSVHVHVASSHLIGYSCHSLIPVLLLTALEKTMDYDRVGLSHVRLDKLLDGLRVEKQKGPFGCLVVHTLAC